MTLALVTTMLAFAASAGAAPAVSADDQAALAGALVKSFGISKEQAASNVQAQARAGDIVGALQKSLGDGFAGVWFDNSSGTFKVDVAPSTDVKAAQATLADKGLSEQSELVPVRSTWNELEAAAADWTQRTALLGAGGEAIVGINAVENAVVVTLAPDAPTDQAASLRDAAGSVANVKVKVVTGPEKLFGARPMACTWPFCDRPLGGAVEIDSSVSTCTAGFLSFSNLDLKPYILTAGHCTTGGITFSTKLSNGSTTHGIGLTWGYTYGASGDAAIIQVSDSYWNVAGGMSAKIAAWGTGNGNYLVYGAGTSYYGLALCRYGRTTNRRCGSDTDASTINTSAFGIGHLTYNDACAASGDSGGPFVGGNVGFGILSLAWGCERPGAWYSEAAAAASMMGVHVGSAS